MTSTLDPILRETWEREAHIEFNQRESVLKGLFRQAKASNMSTHNFTVFDDIGEANEGKAQHADVTITAVPSTKRACALVPLYKSIMIDDFDAFQSDIDIRQSYAAKASSAVWRKFDDLAITELQNSTSSETTLPSANTLNYAGVVAMASALDAQDVPNSDRYGVISPGANTDLLTDTTYINNFHATNNAVKTGMLTDVGGFDLVKSNRLSNGAAGATERRCFFWQKDSVGVAFAKDFELLIDYVPMKMGWLYTARMVVGFKIIDEKGVQYCDVTN